MAVFTKALRQKIVEDFARQNNGWFDPRAFLMHVREAGADHPAFEWFEWDDEAAAEAYRIDQARDFARGLVVKFDVRTIERGPVRIAQVPLVTSPVATRKSGGGYYLTDPQDRGHMAELRRQAATDLRWFIRRYAGAIEAAGGDVETLEALHGLLETGQVAEAA